MKSKKYKEVKRQAIIEGARTIFLTEGYSRSNMDKIAESARVTKQTIYRYFPSKLDLFHSVTCEMEIQFDFSLLKHLFGSCARVSLERFAYKYIQFSISEERLATYRFLINEYDHISGQSCHNLITKEITVHIVRFIERNFELSSPKSHSIEDAVNFWLSMLLSLRSDMLLGMPKPSDDQIVNHVVVANSILLSAVTIKD